MMMDYEKTILLLLIKKNEAFAKTKLLPQYFKNTNYGRLFGFLANYYREHQNIDQFQLASENKDFNINLYMNLLNDSLPIPETWEKALASIEEEVINDYKFRYAKASLNANLTFDEFKNKIEELAKLKANAIKYYKTTSEIDMSKNDDAVFIKSGITDLDKSIKGFALGELSVWSGGNGSGKSTLLSQLAIESITQGFKTLIFSGELKDSRLMKWMNLQFCGRDNLGYNTKYDFYYPAKDPTPYTNNKLFVYDNELGNDINKIITSIYDAVKSQDVKMVILDNLMSMNLSNYGSDKYEVQTKLVTDLSNLAKRLNIHIHFVCHPRKSTSFLRKYDISGTADLTNIADNVFIIHRNNKDFERQTSEMFNWKVPKREEITKRILKEGDTIYNFSNILEICKNREFGIQDMFVGQFFEIKTKRFLNFETENKNYFK